MGNPRCARYRGKARLAQSVERKALNPVVVGSSPTVGVFTNRISNLVVNLFKDAFAFTAARKAVPQPRRPLAPHPARSPSGKSCCPPLQITCS